MNVDFVTAVKMFFINYVNFKGRSTRAEYWWAILFYVIVSSIPFVGYIAMPTLLTTHARNQHTTLARHRPQRMVACRLLRDISCTWWMDGFGNAPLYADGRIYQFRPYTDHLNA